jgi:hypothetical protein
VFAKILAYNKYGDSIESEPGNGAKIITFADAPIDLAEDAMLRTHSSITITWAQGLNNGGSTVIDYRVTTKNSADINEIAT